MKISCKIFQKDKKYTIIVPNKEDSLFLWNNGNYGYNPTNSNGGWGILSIEEAIFLSLEGIIILKDYNNNEFNSEKLLSKKIAVYMNLRKNGWIVRSGINYGTDYIIYRRNIDEEHAPFAIKIITNDFSWRDLIATNRAVSSSKKELIIATFKDDFHEIQYSHVDRIC